jgi:hypothetical protein
LLGSWLCGLLAGRVLHTLNEQKPVPANTGGVVRVVQQRAAKKKSHKEIGKKKPKTHQDY